MERKRFYWECAKSAFRGGWRITEGISFGLSLLGGFLAWKLSPDLVASMNNLLWLIPLGVLIGTIIVGFLLAPYNMYSAKQNEANDLGTELNKIKTMTPRFVLTKIDENFLGNVITTYRDANKVEQEIEHPYFTRIWIANDPSKPEYGVEARYVYGEIEFWNITHTTCYFRMGGRWAETKEIVQGAEPIEIEQITILPNGRPYCMDVGLKYRDENEFYGYNNETPRKATKGFRDLDRKLDKGDYLIRARFRCKGVDTSFWFRIENQGKDRATRLTRTNEPPNPDKEGFQI
jgi:hypothetical protein